MPRRAHQMLESRLVAEWCAQRHPNDEVILNARLGDYPPEVKEISLEGFPPALYMPTLVWADALILKQSSAIIVEGKIRLTPGSLGQLLVYKDAFMKTPEYSQQQAEPPQLLVVYAYENGNVSDTAKALGIDLENYRPAWAHEAMVERLSRDYRKTD